MRWFFSLNINRWNDQLLSIKYDELGPLQHLITVNLIRVWMKEYAPIISTTHSTILPVGVLMATEDQHAKVFSLPRFLAPIFRQTFTHITHFDPKLDHNYA